MRVKILTHISAAFVIMCSGASLLKAAEGAPAAVTASKSANEPLAVPIIKSTEADFQKAEDSRSVASVEQIKGACRATLKSQLSACTDKECEEDAWKEFRICTKQTLTMLKDDAQGSSMKHAIAAANNAKSHEQCLEVFNFHSNQKDSTESEDHLWKVYKSCTDRFSGRGPSSHISLSKKDREVYANEDKLLKAEDRETAEQLNALLTEKKMAEEHTKAKNLEEKKKKIEKESHELTEKRKQAKEALAKVAVKVAPPVTGVGAAINARAPFSEGKMNECQVTFETEVKACQREYDKNAQPRLDHQYVKCAQTAFDKMRVCYATKALGEVQIPVSTHIYTSFGQSITTTDQCDSVILKHMEGCGKDWHCRNEVQRDAWKCKGVVSLVTGGH